MNPYIIKNTFHRILTRPLILVLVAAHVIFMMMIYGSSVMNRGVLPFFSERVILWDTYTWLLGAGLIGKDVSDGILPLLFSRPISRGEYVLSRWAGLVCACSAFLLVDCFIVMLEARCCLTINYSEFFLGVGATLWIIAWTAALLTFFSSIVPSHGDIAIFLGLWLLAYILTKSLLPSGDADVILKAFADIMLPGRSILEPSSSSMWGIVFLRTTLLAGLELCGAILLMQRRQISYISSN